MRPVYITGSSVITALSDPSDIRSGKTTQITLEILGQPWLFPCYCINNPSVESSADRMFEITRQVVADAIESSGIDSVSLQKAGLFVGSTSYSIPLTEQSYSTELQTNPDASPIGLSAYEELTNYIRDTFMPGAKSFSFHTACTSSVNALLYASKLIATGKLNHALVVGLEFFNKTTLLGFHSLDLVSKSKVQPFGIERDGIIIGEGCSAIILSAEKPANPHPISILGGATSVDIDSMTTVKPDGSSIATVIQAALNNTQTSIDQINAIKLHGTASYSNDNAESAGLKKVFGDHLPPAIALKTAIGHTLGACGTNEIVILGHYLENNLLPGLPYEFQADPELGIHLNIEDLPTRPGKFLLNHFGFGGNNTVLIISNAEA